MYILCIHTFVCALYIAKIGTFQLFLLYVSVKLICSDQWEALPLHNITMFMWYLCEQKRRRYGMCEAKGASRSFMDECGCRCISY